MAFEQKGRGNITYKKLTDLKVGESVKGYFLGSQESTTIKGAVSIKLRVDGAVINYNAAGNIKYLLADGEFALGQNTIITRLEDRNVKGKRSTSFSLQQDPADVIMGLAASTSTAAVAASTDSNSSIQQTTSSSGSIRDKLKGLKGASTNSNVGN